jgi:hypothetical protein
MKKERPILFSAPMVQAILTGRKTQTRRIIKPHPVYDSGIWAITKKTTKKLVWLFSANTENGFAAGLLRSAFKCKYGQVGDRLWVRENFTVAHACPGHDGHHGCDDFKPATATVFYQDGKVLAHELEIDTDLEALAKDQYSQAVRALKKKTVPSIHMPRWASRILLEITDVRVERLHSIKEKDAEAEGVEPNEDFPEWTARDCFHDLWDRINGSKAWASNPWVFVIEFKLVKP